MKHLNIEIKAKAKNFEKAREVLKSHNAKFIGIDYQSDTYYRVRNGRLKLREGTIENYLVYYKREDKKEPKKSKVILFKTEKSSELKELLKEALGILVIVKKKREIYFIDNIKFHLDKVEGLGQFIEIEAIDKEGKIGEKKLRQECEFFLKQFDISQEDLISTSYSDLLLQKNKEKEKLYINGVKKKN